MQDEFQKGLGIARGDTAAPRAREVIELKITEIIVSAGRTFNHPFENFSNLRPQVTIKATIGEDEDPEKATKEMQAKTEKLVEDHKNHILDSLHKIEQMAQYERSQANLESQIKTAQEDLEIIRAKGRKLIEEGAATEEIPIFGQKNRPWRRP